MHAVLATVFLSKNPPVTLLFLKSALLFESIAVFAAAFSIILFDKMVRRSAIGSTVAGIVCVVVASPLPFVASEFDPMSRSYFWIDGDVAGHASSLGFAIGWDVSVTFFIHLATLFAPEIVGGLCGYAVWRSFKALNA